MARAERVLGRLSFGPRPGQIERVAEQGVDVWLEQQLRPASLADPRVEAWLKPFAGAWRSPDELAGELSPDGGRELRKKLNRSRQLETVQAAALLRHVWSERQLNEVMVDFWTNHFNVFARKGLVGLFVGDYVERALRPHALGRFEDLLQATAAHPAMLLYLDNARSVAPAGPGAPARRRRRGLNENYARELLELHTLGVDGGYTQHDVIEVARILTGYSVRRLREGSPGFVFRERLHDRGDKHVLGRRFAAGRGQEEVRELLHFLAHHPSTARHLATRLCVRFVSDDPPPSCVRALSAAYQDSGGDIRTVLRRLVALPELYSAPAHKLKTPLELVASSLRALDAEPAAARQLPALTRALGQPLFLQPVPTGYAMDSASWTSSGAVAQRLLFATRLGNAQLPSVRYPREFLARDGDIEQLIRSLDSRLLAGRLSEESRAAIRNQLEGVHEPERRRSLALSMALASPEFQHH